MEATLSNANRLYRRRQDDQTYPTVAAMVQAATLDKQHSAERTYSWRDLKFTPTDPSADADVRLVSPTGHAAELTHWSFGQAARTLGAPAGFLRDDLSPQLAADVLNYRISQQPNASDAVILVRKPNGSPQLQARSITSKTYGRLWDAELYEAAEQTVFGSRTSNGKWQNAPTWEGDEVAGGRGDRDSWVLRIDGGSIVNDPSARDGNGAMYRAILMGNSEVGAGSAWIDCIYFRFICGNWLLWGALIDKMFRRRHVGNNVLRDTVRELANTAYRWNTRSAATDDAIIKGLIAHEIAHTKDAVISELRAVGMTQEDAEAAYVRCEQTENASPRSYWGIAQGITRVSQDATHMDARSELDKLAAKVLQLGRAKVAA
jgi:hypothetical protein